MNKARDLLTLAILAFQNGQHGNAAKFFSAAMGSEDLDSFVSELTRNVPRSATQGPLPSSENTIAPSLVTASDGSSLEDVVDEIEAVFRSECSFLDEGDEEVEVRATDLDNDPPEADSLEASGDTEESVASSGESEAPRIIVVAGPVRIKQ